MIIRPISIVCSSDKIMKKNNKLAFTLNLDNYSLESVYQAAYTMLDRLYFYFDKKSARSLLAEIQAKEDLAAPALEKLKGEFFNELLNSELRLQVAKRTKKVREALIAQALIGASADKTDYVDDPLGIALPWEEKYGGETKPKKIKRERKPAKIKYEKKLAKIKH